MVNCRQSTSTVTVATTVTPACWTDSSLTVPCAARKKRSGRFIIDDPFGDILERDDPIGGPGIRWVGKCSFSVPLFSIPCLFPFPAAPPSPVTFSRDQR